MISTSACKDSGSIGAHLPTLPRRSGKLGRKRTARSAATNLPILSGQSIITIRYDLMLDT